MRHFNRVNYKRWSAIPFGLLFFAPVLFFQSACSSGPEVKRQKYADLRETWTFEHNFEQVWKGMEEALRNHKIVERDPENVSVVKMKSITDRTLKTDWIYGRSRDKYIEFKVNDFPKKKYLQTRFIYEVDVQRVLGGTKVTVTTEEEIERLRDDGTPMGFEAVDQRDTTRANELLEKVKLAILGAG